MTEQKRKFTLGEVHTKMGAMGEVHLDHSLLDVLNIRPGDFITFTISQEGVVTVTGEKKAPTAKPAPTTNIISTDVTQPPLFDAGQPTPQTQPKRRTRSLISPAVSV